MSHCLFVTIAAVAVAAMTGCGGSQPPIGAPGAIPQAPATAGNGGGTSWMLPEAKSKIASTTYKDAAALLYATNQLNKTDWDGVTVYRAEANDPAPLARISADINFPFGACIDGQGTLYVVSNANSTGWVSEYPLGRTKPSKIIRDGISGPAYCAIDAKGNLWVTNYGSANVTEYLAGSQKPHTVITKGIVNPVGIAIDPSGNVYVGNFSSSSGDVEVYAPGSKSPSRVITDGATSPRGLAVDSNGTLYVTNLYQSTVAEYRSGQSDPFQTITQAMDRPAGITLDKDGTLYVSNIANNTIVEFAPGSVKPLKREITKGLYEPNGIAYYPPLLP